MPSTFLLLFTVDVFWFLHMFECFLVSCDLSSNSSNAVWFQMPPEEAHMLEVNTNGLVLAFMSSSRVHITA